MNEIWDLMPIDHIPDWEMRVARQDAFWSGEIIDRPVVCIGLYSPNPDYPAPESHHATLKDRWLDVEFQAERALSTVMNMDCLGDALPIAMPNFGPELTAALLGCDLVFGEDTSWTTPCLEDWADADKIGFSKDNFYWKRLQELTDALLEVGKGRFYTAISDLHSAGDIIAALRDPEQLNIDLIESPDKVKRLEEAVTSAYLDIYDCSHEKLAAAGQAISSWPRIVSTKKWYVPSNDFSCMISKPMFDDFFLQALVDECRHLEGSIYHLDGPNALQHLDSLLEVKELNAIQWIFGAGNGRASDWMDLYKKCQAAGKGLQIMPDVDEFDAFVENLRPEGLWLWVNVNNRDEADAILKKAAAWK